MIIICLNVKSQRTKKVDVLSQGTNDSKNLRCETMYISDYEHVNISSFAVLGIKLWLEEDGDLNRNDPLYSFKFIQTKAQNRYKMLFISQNLKAAGPLGENFDFFSLFGFDIQSNFDYRTSRIKFYSVRSLKCYLNEKNLIHG